MRIWGGPAMGSDRLCEVQVPMSKYRLPSPAVQVPVFSVAHFICCAVSSVAQFHLLARILRCAAEVFCGDAYDGQADKRNVTEELDPPADADGGPALGEQRNNGQGHY